MKIFDSQLFNPYIYIYIYIYNACVCVCVCVCVSQKCLQHFKLSFVWGNEVRQVVIFTQPD